MKTIAAFKSVLALVAVLLLGACDTTPTAARSGSTYSSSSTTGNAYAGYGVVQFIELVPISTGSDERRLGAGTIAGAVVGGVLGNQVGSGDGKTAATVLGAAGGAYAGHQLEKRNQQTTDGYKITVRMRDNTYQTVIQVNSANLREGDQVLIENGVARRY